MVKRFVPSRFVARIEALMGDALKASDMSFVHSDLPISELELLREFLSVDSATLNRGGVSAMQDRVAEVLQELGFHLRTLKGEARFADLIVAERPGRRAREFISLITHTDTVLANERAFSLDLSVGRAFGSGVIDNKGGVVVGLSALRRFLTHFPDTEYSLRWICSPNEEMGSIGFTEIFRELGCDSVMAFGLEPALDNGAIIHQRRGNRWYDIEIIGREAHAGRSYGFHANAAHDLASKVQELAALTNYRKHISVNVGHIHAGKDKHNVICGFAHAKLDVRFPNFEARDGVHRKIEKILAEPIEVSVCGTHKTSTAFKIVDDCPPFALTSRSKKLARSYAALVSQLEGRKIKSQAAGGAGDVNYLSTDTNFVLDGLGPVGGEMHTRHEFVNVDSLKTRAQALAGFLHHLQTWRC
ncbi:MAG: M20/M25/M40 family metallo-hydrolase [Bdellovibrionales bacterium]|nr:M20/M25/M40 family metallo-hydrolase [Bdellovibrionales bacterium]